MTDDTTPTTAPRALADFTDAELVLLESILRSGLVVHPNLMHRALTEALRQEIAVRELVDQTVARGLVDRALERIRG